MKTGPLDRVALAHQLVDALYNGKTDRAGDFLSNHVRRVVLLLPKGTSVKARVGVAFHDVFEDFSNVSPQLLLNLGFNSYSIKLAEILTHRRGESYVDYIGRIVASNLRDALEGKYADLQDNVSLERRRKMSHENQMWHTDRCDKVYFPAMRRLEFALQDLRR